MMTTHDDAIAEEYQRSKPQPWRLHTGRSVCRIACLWRLCFQCRRDVRRYSTDASGPPLQAHKERED
jgi:hypothetical protein